VRVADAEVRIVRATNYARIVEDAIGKTVVGSGKTDLEAELCRAKEDVSAATRERAEGEAEQRLAEAHQVLI